MSIHIINSDKYQYRTSYPIKFEDGFYFKNNHRENKTQLSCTLTNIPDKYPSY